MPADPLTDAEIDALLATLLRLSFGAMYDAPTKDDFVSLARRTADEAIAAIRQLGAERNGHRHDSQKAALDYVKAAQERQAARDERDRLAAQVAMLREALHEVMQMIATDDLIPESVSYMRQAREALAATDPERAP